MTGAGRAGPAAYWLPHWLAGWQWLGSPLHLAARWGLAPAGAVHLRRGPG